MMREYSFSIRLIACVLVFVFAFTSIAASKASKTYDKAVDKMAEGAYAEAANLFDSISSYEDASLQAMYCKALEYGANGNYDEAIKALEFLGGFKDSEYLRHYFSICKKAFADGATVNDVLEAANDFDAISIFRDSENKANECRQLVYDLAIKCYRQGEYNDAIYYFSLIQNYKDSEEQIEICEISLENAKKEERYEEAKSMMQSQQYGDAIVVFEELGDYKDSQDQISACTASMMEAQYLEALNLYKTGSFFDAKTLLSSLKGYKDVDELLTKIENTIEKYKIGNVIEFGHYEQDNNIENGEENIEWIVLANEGKGILIVSKYALDYQQYNKLTGSGLWEKCSLRTWLNETFLTTAFNEKEKAIIKEEVIRAGKNPKYDNSTVSKSLDRVFLLSISEIDKYFSNNKDRNCTLTLYASMKKNNSENGENNKDTWWWLRTPGHNTLYASGVNNNGIVDLWGKSVIDNGAVRPALWIIPDL